MVFALAGDSTTTSFIFAPHAYAYRVVGGDGGRQGPVADAHQTDLRLTLVTELRTNRLILRRARPEDLEGMHAVLTDERAMRYWTTGPHADLAETERWLD